MFIINWLKKLYKDFINIYDDSEFFDGAGGGLIPESKSFGEDYIRERVMAGDPVTGKRKISVKKILFRIVIISLIALFVFYFIRLNTNVSFWGNR